jgi:hypothetical protein
LLGFFSQYTNENATLEFRCKLLSEALCVATPESMPLLLSVDPMKEVYHASKVYEKILSHNEVLKPQQIKRMCKVFNVRSLEAGEVGVIKILILPHPESLQARTIKYQWNAAMDTIVGGDFQAFMESCEEEWTQLRHPKAPKLCPVSWGLFTDKSYENIIRYHLEFTWKSKQIDPLEIRSLSRQKTTHCCTLWETSRYPLLMTPESVTISCRPFSSSYNPFELESQRDLLKIIDEPEEEEDDESFALHPTWERRF